MSKYKLINYLKERVVITPDDEDFIIETFEIKTFKKNEIITHKAEICKFLYFLVSGITRNFYINDKGNEVTRLITYENRFFTNFLSFNKQLPSREIIECVEDCVVLFIDRDKFYKILQEVPLTMQVFTFILLDSYTLHLERLEELNCMTPFERFNEMMLKKNELVFKLSNKVLASYLGITQETCSRLKKKLYQK